MAWFQYYVIATGEAISLASVSVPPGAGNDVVEVSATDDRPVGIWDPVLLIYVIPDLSNIISTAQLRARFEDAEWDDFINFARGNSPAAQIIDGLKAYIQAGAEVNLTATLVIDSVDELESQGVIAAGRAAEILDPNNQPVV